MTEKNLSLLLHAYQPPWQKPEVLHKIANECYSWLTNWIANQDDLKVTLNINYSLTKLLLDNGLENIIDNIGRGVERGSIDLTGTGAYHPFMPLEHEDQLKRQIDINNKKHREIFGDLYDPTGFFPSEMGISLDVARIINEAGFDWTITDAPVYSAHNSKSIPFNSIAKLNGIDLFFRSDWSQKFAMEYPDSGLTNTQRFVGDLNSGMNYWFGNSNGYLSMAFDMETIGHHQRYNSDYMNFFSNALKSNNISSIHFKDIKSKFTDEEILLKPELYKGSWSTTEEQINDGNYYPLWNHPKSLIHKIMWEIRDLSENLLNENDINSNEFHYFSNIYDKSMNSCKYWWADPWRFNPDLIKLGIEDNFAIIYGISKLKKNNMLKLEADKSRLNLNNALESFNGY